MFYVKTPVLYLNDTSIEQNAGYLLYARAVKLCVELKQVDGSHEMEDGKTPF